MDATFLVDLQRELAGRSARGALRLMEENPHARPWITLVTWMEFADGFPSKDEEACLPFLSWFPVVPPDRKIVWRASRVSRGMRPLGIRIGDHDFWIAVTALEKGLPLITRNTRHFMRIPGLTVQTC